MNRTLKWVLGLLLVLVVFAGLAFAGYFVYTHWNGGTAWMMNRGEDEYRSVFPWRNMPGLDRDRMPMFGYHMPGSRFGGFFFSILLGSIFRLGILVLVVIGIIALVRAIWPSRTVVAPASIAAVMPASTSSPVSAVDAASGEPALSACASCASSLQPGWKHCPNCGAPRTT